ncbi:MAG: isoprenylcysteine carboxylmethyltransferase family protein [Deltaproteobacteria bacterium]|nr:isoprenylcysteine carboxylmethyltransferase family protein [Deltaproteobacteria bacterium]
MPVTPVQRMRRTVSWVAALAVLTVILFTKHDHGPYLAGILKTAGFALVFLCVLGRIWCAVYIGGTKDRELCTDGPYSLCRNPLYLFSFFGVAGLMSVSQNLYLLILSIPLFWLYYHFVITSEEKGLEKRFGKEFITYRSRTNRIIPSFRNYWSRERVEVSTKVMVRAISDAGVFLWILIFLELLEYVDITKCLSA